MIGEAEPCCGALYSTDAVGMLLGDIWHPGGSELTGRLAARIPLDKNDLILDVGCGVGATPRFLSRQFGCRVVGMDISPTNTMEASRHSEGTGRVGFLAGDAHNIPVAEHALDSVILECTLSTIREKSTVVREILRVLKPGGRLGMTDVVVEADVPEELRSPLMKAYCVGGALSTEGYCGLLEREGFKVVVSENRKQDTLDFLEQVRRRLFIAKLLVGIGKLKLDPHDLDYARRVLSLAGRAAEEERLGYALFVASTAV